MTHPNQRAGSGRDFTADEISVIRERFHGWERASASTLAAVFGVSVQRITAIVHSNRPDGMTPTLTEISEPQEGNDDGF